MNKITLGLLAISILFFQSSYLGSTTGAVTLVGGIIKAKNLDLVSKKYKRKDCPVCKGKGWYISGDKISKVDCGYCEPDTKSIKADEQPKLNSSIIISDTICGSNGCRVTRQ